MVKETMGKVFINLPGFRMAYHCLLVTFPDTLIARFVTRASVGSAFDFSMKSLQ